MSSKNPTDLVRLYFHVAQFRLGLIGTLSRLTSSMVLKPLKIMNDGEIVKEGHLKRLKTQKKRYFVLRSSPRKGKSRLEYYESQKKFRHKNAPKRVIYLDNCFNVVKKEDPKKRPVLILFTRDDAFGVIANSEDELNSWMRSIEIELRKEEILSASVSTWPVTIKPRGLGTSRNLSGQYDLQLSNRNLSLVIKDTRELAMEVELVNIRRCGHADCFFFIELGRSAATGAGEMWIQVEDQIIAQNMHETILSSMHNISVSGDLPNARRRCASEAKRPKSRPRPVSAFINPIGHGRTGTEPNLSVLPHNSFPSSSTTDLLSTESSKKEKSPLMNRLMPKHKFNSVSGSLNSSCRYHGDTDSDHTDKVLMSPPSNTSPPSLLPNNPQPEYVNIGQNGVSLLESTDGSIQKRHGNRRRVSDSYIDMQPPESHASETKGTTTQQTTPEGGYISMTPLRQEVEKQHRDLKSPGLRSEFAQPKLSSSPRQGRSNDSALPNKLDIREFVSLKKSPVTARRNPRQDYVDMSPVFKPKDVPRLYVNFVPSSNEKDVFPTYDRRDEPLYVNIVPGENFPKRGKQLDVSTSQNGHGGMSKVSSYEDMNSYVNVSPEDGEGKKPSFKAFRQQSLESVLSQPGPEYVNIDFSKITKSRSAVDMNMPEYVNFVPGRIFENCESNSSEKDGSPELNAQREQNGHGATAPPAKIMEENERWKKSARNRRRESEPARLEHYKFTTNATLSATKEDEDFPPLNYVLLDLSKEGSYSTTSSSGRCARPNRIDLSSCNHAKPGPRSAPVESTYAEIDFTKSDGIRQARQEVRELNNTA